MSHLRWLLAAVPLCTADVAPRPIVNTRDGNVRGLNIGNISIFRGIPFAAPPVKGLRWKPPQPVRPWSNILDASSLGNACADIRGHGEEDCLYINLYTPMQPHTNLPVLLWVHGGAYESGSANDFDAFADSLTEFYIRSSQPAIVVTTNYRLNIFGFLGSEALRSRDDVYSSTGNYGIQDQRAAFRWVQDNIVAFGGDPRRVMIFGCSAGAGSMTNHLSMPRSAGLFSSIAIESGSFSPWVTQPMSYSENLYQEVLAFTGCKDPECLEALPRANLTAASVGTPSGHCCKGVQGKLFIPWAPTIDGSELVAHPWELVGKGNFNRVPVLHGTNTDEGAAFEDISLNASESEFWTQFNLWYGPEMAKSVGEIYLSKDVHPHSPLASDAWWAAERANGDQIFHCAARRASEQLSKHGADVFQYRFNHYRASNPLVNHGSEVPYVFANVYGPTHEEKNLSEQMASYWYRHAAFGNPNGNGTSHWEGDVLWPKYEPGKKAHLRLDIASAGGVKPIPGGIREATCPAMTKWIEQQFLSASTYTVDDEFLI